MMENNIFVKGLSKQFPGFSLENVTFRVPKGRIVGFIGENGAGKTTTISLILNELNRDSGQIEIMGKDNRKDAFKEETGVVFDECHFHDVFTVHDINTIFAGIYAAWDREFFYHSLKRFKIPLDKKIGVFSRGTKMKLSIICALAHRPKLLILDEATTGLDPIVREEILDFFLEFIQDETHSILFSSHMISDVENIADYVVLIHRGHILFEARKDDLIYEYGIIRCTRQQFTEISSEDYIAYKETPACVECLTDHKYRAKGKYQDFVVDDASLEEIMKFYIR